MAVIVVASNTDATGNGWNFCGAGTNWFAEKATSHGGKLMACASSSANLIAGIQQIEVHQERLGAAGSKSTSFKGHI